MPANRISAPVGSRVNVIGSSSATVSAGPMPGSTPTSVPIVTPIRARSRLVGVSASPNPVISWEKESIAQNPQIPAGNVIPISTSKSRNTIEATMNP